MRDAVVDLTSRLVAIDSVNPSLVRGGAGEDEIARFIAAWASAAALEADVLELTPGRPSVLVRARGTGGGRTLLLCGHGVGGAGPVVVRLGELDGALGARTHPLLGRGSVHASLIEGGAEMSSYPARCALGLERRTLPGETAADVEREVASLIEGVE